MDRRLVGWMLENPAARAAVVRLAMRYGDGMEIAFAPDAAGLPVGTLVIRPAVGCPDVLLISPAGEVITPPTVPARGTATE